MGIHRAFSAGRRITPASLASLVGALLLVSASGSWAGAPRTDGYQYLSPVPGSRGNSPTNNVVLREGRRLDRAAIDRLSLEVRGSASGLHRGELALSDDGRTLVFLPERPYSPGEDVTVRLAGEARGVLPPVEFGFSVAAREVVAPLRFDPEEGFQPTVGPSSSAPIEPVITVGDLPSTYPDLSLLASNAPDSGYIFCTPTNRTLAQNRNLLILDNHAMPIYYRLMGSRMADFKKLPDGRLSYFDTAAKKFYALDTLYAVVDSFKMGNGYNTDFHDIQVLPNNHALLFAYDPQIVDMSVIVPGGVPDCIVTGLVIQEIDAAKNVVFQWRSWDHFQITDLADCYSLLTPTIDAVHGNSLEYDFDGNILLSSRYLNEITKINRTTGAVIWRFGLNARNNQFTILDDPLGFSDQHDARRLPNGHLTLYDNHNCLNPKNSRALEYEIDEQNMTARLVWEYRHTPDQSATATGNAQRRANGGTTICWGQIPTPPNITEIHPDGSTAWEVQFWPPPTLSATYRAFRFPWRATVFTPGADDLDFGSVAAGDSAELALVVTNHTGSAITLTSFPSLDAAFMVVEAPPLVLPANGSATVHARFKPSSLGSAASTLYLRSSSTTQVIAYPITVHGTGVSPASVPIAGAGPVHLGVAPSPTRGTARITFALPREANIRLTVHDAQGRLVSVLAHGAMPAGPHEAVWDARLRGGPAAPGLYFVRLDGLEQPVVSRFVVTR